MNRTSEDLLDRVFVPLEESAAAGDRGSSLETLGVPISSVIDCPGEILESKVHAYVESIQGSAHDTI